MSDSSPLSLETLRHGGKVALARALTFMETHPDSAETTDLLESAYRAPTAHVIGITGPPGVGKSTLMKALIAQWRSRQQRVGVIAVDPSSRRTGGALLGDRTRLQTDPQDQGVFVRSMAARDHLGGLASQTVNAMVLMRALFDITVIETVGVGQSETDIVQVADSVVFCVQPGSGDSLQFMKAGIAEIPHLILITKADMAPAAQRAQADVKGALSLTSHFPGHSWTAPVLLVSSQQNSGIAEAVTALDQHYQSLIPILADLRQHQGEDWLQEFIRERFGREGLKRAHSIYGNPLKLSQSTTPFTALSSLIARLSYPTLD